MLRWLLAALGAGLVGLTACDARPASTTTRSSAPTVVTADRGTEVSNSSSTEGKLAPDFTFTLFQGEDMLGDGNLQLSQLRGKPLVLNFWARLCGPCWHEMPELQEFYEEYQGKIGLLGIDIGQFTGLGSPLDFSKLLGSLGIEYPVGFTDDGTVVPEYGVIAMPTTIFITGKGDIFRTWTGALDRETVTRLANDVLRQEPD